MPSSFDRAGYFRIKAFRVPLNELRAVKECCFTRVYGGFTELAVLRIIHVSAITASIPFKGT